MKKRLLLVASIAVSSLVYSQGKNEAIHPTLIPITFQGETGRLDHYQAPSNVVNEVTKTEKIGYHPKNDWILNESVNPNALPQGVDPALQKDYADAAPSTKAPTYSWEGMPNQPVSPGDPSVDVGPNHVVQMINGASGAYIQVYDKTGNTIGSQVYFDNFIGMAGGSGDPIVLYDERADRWLLSEFASAGNVLHVAISTTPDPTGTYFTYTYTTASFPDYPKYSIWEDSYIVTTNEANSRIYALDRTSLLAGTPATAQVFNMTNFGTIGFQAATPVSLNGTTLPPVGSPAMVMRMRDDAWAGVATDALEIWNLDIDWASPGNSTFSQNATLLMGAPFDSELCGYTSFSCIDQPGSTTNLDPLRELLMNRIHYRNFGTHESMVTCHVTDVDGTDHAGIRWYELRRTGGATGTWSIYQEGTYSPDGYHRWMPSIGISASGNIGLAYNLTGTVAGVDVFPSLYYTGRKECDPLGTMTEPETIIIQGAAAANSNRYGDYNAMGLDPTDGETFYFTGMYNPATSWSTRIGAFSIASCGATVAFNSSAFSVDESSANVVSGCLDYVDVLVPITIANAPTQNAGIVVSVSGGTATSGVDFDILNTTFTLNGATLTQSVTIRVYNDNYVEGAETIDLSYTLNANSGDAAAGIINQTVTITINDDDLSPANAVGPTVTIFSENFDSGTMGAFTTVNNGTPADLAWQVGDDASVPNGAFAISANNGTSFMWIDDDDCNCDQNDVDLIFPNVDLTNYVGATLEFDTYFGDNTYLSINENADLYVSVGGGADVLVGPLTASVNGGAWVTQNFDLSGYIGNSNVVFKVKYSDATGWLYGCTVDDVVVTGQSPVSIQTAINTSAGDVANLGPNETVHLYDPTTGNVMMSLENTSAFDYGCVTVEVDRPGTTPTAVQFNTTITADFLHSKTYTIVPANSNPSGTFNVTLYYKEAEVAAWETATGNVRANAEIVKVSGANQISDVTPATAASYTISSSPAGIGAFVGDVTFTASFNTGFSGFGVGIYTPIVLAAPVANFSATPVTICENETVTFTDLSTNTPTSWSWNFGDGSSSTLQNPTHVYANNGVYNVTLTATNVTGSDSDVQNALITVNQPTNSTQNITLCPTESIVVGANTYNSAGTYTDVLTNAVGCDSTVTTNVTMVSPTTLSQNVSICSGQTYSIGTSSYTSAGTYTDVLVNAAGCDSTVTTTITVTASISTTQNLTLCDGASVTVGANTYATAGTFTDILSASVGCDSIVTTIITLGTASNSNQTVSICPGSSVTVGTSTYTSAGTFTDVLTNASGCDSIIVTTVSMLSTTSSTQNISICPGGSVMVGTSTYTASGTFTDVLTNTAGCDSTVTTIVSVLNSSTSSQTVSICPGGSVTVGTSTYNSIGIYTDVLTNAAGCDSTVSTTVTMLSPTNSTQVLEVCEGTDVIVGTSTYTTTGVYTDVITNAAGCDSTIITDLTVNAGPVVAISPTQIETMCFENNLGTITLIGSPVGGTFSGPGVTGNIYDINVAGVGTHTITYSFTDGNGCTSTIEIISIVLGCAGVTEEGLEGVSLFPNPTNGQFTVSGLEIGTAYEIYDNSGKLVASGIVQSTEERVELLNVETGIYYLRSTVKEVSGSIKLLIAK
jgi:PKD repeat protein